MRNSAVAFKTLLSAKHFFDAHTRMFYKFRQLKKNKTPRYLLHFLVISKIPKILFHKMFAILLLTSPDF